MEREEQTEFLVEKIQPSSLRSKKLDRSYRLRVVLNIGLIGGLGFALGIGLIFGLNGKLGVCLKHFVLRHLLYANGFAPWNYAHFLVSCSDCLLLQRVGGRFRFIHKTVQDHFAAMNFEKP